MRSSSDARTNLYRFDELSRITCRPPQLGELEHVGQVLLLAWHWYSTALDTVKSLALVADDATGPGYRYAYLNHASPQRIPPDICYSPSRHRVDR